MNADDTSERIKRAALARFVEVGFGSTTVEEIAAGASVGVATLYRRWPDKAALANELVIDYIASMDEVMAAVEGGTPKSRFMVLWRRFWEAANADPELLLFVEAQAYAGFMTDDVAAQKGDAAERWMTSMQQMGFNADPVVAGSMMVGTVTAMFRGGVEVDPDDLGERLWAAVRVAA